MAFGVVEASGSGIWTGAKVTHINILIASATSLHAHEAVIVHRVRRVKASIVPGHAATTIGKLTAGVVLVRLVQGVRVAVCSGIAAAGNSCVVASGDSSRREVTNIELSIELVLVAKVAVVVAYNGLLACVVAGGVVVHSGVELIGGYVVECVLILSSIARVEGALLAVVHGIACSSGCPLLTHLGLGNGLGNGGVVAVVGTIACSCEDALVGAIKELRRHHHLLLIGIGVGCFALVDQVEEVSLVGSCILMSHSTRCSNAVVAHTTGRRSKCTLTVSFSLVDHLHVVRALVASVIVQGTIGWSIAASQLGHEVSVEHCLAHLHLLSWVVGLVSSPEAPNSCLVKHMVLVDLGDVVATVYVGEHFVNAGVVG